MDYGTAQHVKISLLKFQNHQSCWFVRNCRGGSSSGFTSSTRNKECSSPPIEAVLVIYVLFLQQELLPSEQVSGASSSPKRSILTRQAAALRLLLKKLSQAGTAEKPRETVEESGKVGCSGKPFPSRVVLPPPTHLTGWSLFSLLALCSVVAISADCCD